MSALNTVIHYFIADFSIYLKTGKALQKEPLLMHEPVRKSLKTKELSMIKLKNHRRRFLCLEKLMRGNQEKEM